MDPLTGVDFFFLRFFFRAVGAASDVVTGVPVNGVLRTVVSVSSCDILDVSETVDRFKVVEGTGETRGTTAGIDADVSTGVIVNKGILKKAWCLSISSLIFVITFSGLEVGTEDESGAAADGILQR